MTATKTLGRLSGGHSAVRDSGVQQTLVGPVYSWDGETVCVVQCDRYDGEAAHGAKIRQLVLCETPGNSFGPTNAYAVEEVGPAYRGRAVPDDREHWYRTLRLRLVYQMPALGYAD